MAIRLVHIMFHPALMQATLNKLYSFIHKSTIHLYAVKVILSEVSAIFYFILKEIGTIKRFYSVYGVYYGLLHFI